MSRRLLVTGAAGFVGREVVRLLESSGEDVVAIEHAWRDADELAAGVGPGEIGRCIHLGWYARPADYLVADGPNLRSLASGIELVELLRHRHCHHLVAVGTSAEYEAQHRPLVETDPIRPWSVYGAAKASFHLLLQSSLRPDPMGVAWARLFNVTGPGESPQRLLPTVAASLLRGESIDLTPGEQVRDFLDVGDVATALVALCETRAVGAFNVSSGRGVPLRTILTLLGDALGAPQLLRFGARPRLAGDPGFVVGDNARLTQATGWEQRIQLEDMIDGVARYWAGSRAFEGMSGRQ